MEPFLRSLVRLQELSLEVARLNGRISQIPEEIKTIDKQEAAAAGAVSDAKKIQVSSQKKRKEGEASLQDLEQKILKYNEQSSAVKTNDQYRAIMREIDGVKAEIGDVEEKILIAMDESDQLVSNVKEAEKVFAERKKEFETKRNVVKKEISDVTAQKVKVESDLASVKSEVPADAMAAYIRTTKLRGEVAMAQAQDERCLVCNVRLRPQTFAEIRKNNTIINCESCRRILYYIPEATADESESAPDPSSAATPGGAPASESDPA